MKKLLVVLLVFISLGCGDSLFKYDTYSCEGLLNSDIEEVYFEFMSNQLLSIYIKTYLEEEFTASISYEYEDTIHFVYHSDLTPTLENFIYLFIDVETLTLVTHMEGKSGSSICQRL